jgi:predicted TIM-barrel fold metal-dependent hydrolase
VASADCHISAPHDIYQELSPGVRDLAPRFEKRDGFIWYLSDGLPDYPSLPENLDGIWDEATTRMMCEREYRLTWGQMTESQFSQRQRIEDQLRDGVEAEVLYHGAPSNICASPNLRYQCEVARLMNDWLSSWVRGYEHRMIATAVLPLYLDEMDATIAELKRARKLGFKTANLPVVVPWLPYHNPAYEPLWSAFEDLDMIAAFHTFSGNAYMCADFADALNASPELLAEGRRRVANTVFTERLALTVMGMAAGMSPLVHLCGSGILERHPRLRFVVVEAEMGWLAWVLQSMDTMAHKRKGHMRNLRLKLLPSEYFRRQGWITFTDDEVGLSRLDQVGADRVLWSNDYCHDEGTFLESRAVIKRQLGKLSAADQRRLLWDNAKALYKLDADAILADRRRYGESQTGRDTERLSAAGTINS